MDIIIRIGTRYPQTLSQLGVEGIDDEEDEDVIDDDELFDDEDDDFEDEEDEDLDDEDDEFEDDDDEEELSGGMDVEAIYEQADHLLEEFQGYLKNRDVALPEMMSYEEMIKVFVDDYLAAYEVGKLTDMNRDEIDTYCREYLLQRERISKRKLAEINQVLAQFYTFLGERGHMPQKIAEPIVQYCQH